jgi:uncharacterized membrane protein
MRNVYLKAVGLGVIAGMRSLSAPAFVSGDLSQRNGDESANSVFGFMRSPTVAKFFSVAAAGEILADKLPIIPDRIAPGPLLGRMVSGAVCGAAVCEAEGEPLGVGAVAGGLAAVGSAFAYYHLRRRIGEEKHVPDVLLGLAEDAIVIAAGMTLVSGEAEI